MAEGNGWSAYEKLVLSKLDTLDKSQKELTTIGQTLTTKVALMEQTISMQSNYDERLQKLETVAVTQETLKKERRWYFGTAIAFIGSVLVPVIVILIGNGGLF